MFNPLSPEIDQYLISPNNITLISNIVVTRIKEMITNYRSSWLLNKFSLSAPQEMYGEYILMLGCKGLMNGLFSSFLSEN